MSSAIQFDPIRLPPEAETIRGEVRAFLREEIDAGTFDPMTAPYRSGFNPEFSRRVGQKGWIGLRSCPGAWCKSVALYAAPGG